MGDAGSEGANLRLKAQRRHRIRRETLPAVWDQPGFLL
jgi:hypothetical protein